MNGPVFAASVAVALIAAALIAAALLLKKRTSQKKTPKIEAVAPTDNAAQQSEQASEPTRASTVGSEIETIREEPEVAEFQAMEPVALEPDTDSGAATATIDPEEEAIFDDIDEELVFAELGETAAEVSAEEKLAQPDKGQETKETAPLSFAIEEEPELSAVQPEPDGEEEPALAPEFALTLEAYAIRLNDLEERQRLQLSQAIQHRDEKLRDRLQRELVIMNDKLALLADSYAAEMACYQQILETLEQLRDKDDTVEISAAVEKLIAGEPQAAETFFARLSEQPHPFAARAAFHSGQLAECRVDLQKALDLYRRAVELAPENPQYLHAAGKTARSLYNYKEALPWLESFVRFSLDNPGTEAVDLALAQRELAYTYVLSGQHQKAGPLYKEAMTVLATKLGQEHPEMATSWYQIGELQETLGEYDKAVALYQKSLAIFEEKRGQEHPVLAGILDKLAALCMELEMEKEAVPLYERLVRIREKALRPTHPQLALSLNNLAESYRLQGRYADAEACYQKSLVINETLHGAEHPSVAAVLQELAKLCTSQRKSEEAQQYQQRATAIFQKSVEASEKKNGQEALTLEL